MFFVNLQSPVEKAKFITLRRELCQGCGECIEVCNFDVFEKIVLSGKEKVRIADGENCRGCNRCIAVCPGKAIKKLS